MMELASERWVVSTWALFACTFPGCTHQSSASFQPFDSRSLHTSRQAEGEDETNEVSMSL